MITSRTDIDTRLSQTACAYFPTSADHHCFDDEIMSIHLNDLPLPQSPYSDNIVTALLRFQRKD